MTQSETILEYIDGTLDHDAEQALFDSMARQPELRSTLRQFVSIGSAVHADREAYAPPAHVEQSLLSGLGLVPASAGVVAGASATGGLMTWLGGKFGGMTLSFLAGILLAGSMVYWMTRDGGSLAPDRQAASTTSIAASGSAPAGSDRSAATGSGIVTGGGAVAGGASSVPGASGASPAQGAGMGSAAVDRPGREIAMGSDASSSLRAPRVTSSSSRDFSMARGRSRNDGGSGSSDRSRMSENTASSDRPRATSTSSNDGSRSNGGSDLGGLRSGATSDRSPNDGGGTPTQVDRSGSVPVTPAIPTIDAVRLRTAPSAPASLLPADRSALPPAPRAMTPSQSSPIEPESPGVAREAFAELRGKVGSSLNPTNAKSGSSSVAFMNNMAAGAYMMIAPSFALGVEGGAEAYDQVLNFDSGDTDRVEQRPIYGWGGVAGRYYLGTIPGLELRPFMQGTLGLTSAGPLGRLRLGTGYDLGAAALNIGVEASTLVYTFNGRPLMSGRWGATVGAEVRLW